jgi:hypothetical protein
VGLILLFFGRRDRRARRNAGGGPVG